MELARTAAKRRSAEEPEGLRPVRQRSAKPLFVGSIPTRASNNLRKIRPFHSRRERTILSQNGEQETKPDEKTGRETGRETGRPEIPQKDGVPRFSALEVFDPEQPFLWPSKNLFGGGSRLTGSTLDEAQAGRIKTKTTRLLRTFAARSPVVHHHPTIRNRPRASVSLLAGIL